jgi:HMG (high mobility group) box
MSALKPPLSSKKTSGGRPHRARSSFVCFAHSKKDDFPSAKEEQLLQLVAPAWNALSDRDRAEWDEVARQDKLR